MSPIDRTGFGLQRVFSPKERQELLKLLKRRGEEAERFLDAVQAAIPHLNADWQAVGERPAELPATSLRVLKRIETCSRDLERALDKLDPVGSYWAFMAAENRMNCPGTNVDELMETLVHVWDVARVAQNFCDEPRPGHPVDRVEGSFIARVGLLYQKHFGRRPPYSRNTSFPRFIGYVLGLVLPGNPHSAGDNSKFVEKALKSIKIIN